MTKNRNQRSREKASFCVGAVRKGCGRMLLGLATAALLLSLGAGRPALAQDGIERLGDFAAWTGLAEKPQATARVMTGPVQPQRAANSSATVAGE